MNIWNLAHLDGSIQLQHQRERLDQTMQDLKLLQSRYEQNHLPSLRDEIDALEKELSEMIVKIKFNAEF